MSIDMVSDIPIYTQICQQIIKGIATGALKTGDPMPSVRQLGSDLGVNLHTINKAYNFLKADGFLVVNRRKGVMVNDPNGFKADDVYKNGLENKMRTLMYEAYARGLDDTTFNEMINAINEEIKGGSNG